jgi:hypothetical protein
MGLYEKITIESDGSIQYTSNHYNDISNAITTAELEDLLNKTEFFTTDISYKTKSNVADFFAYKLIVETTSGTKTVEWVDAWASEETLPSELEELQNQILIIIQSLHQEN